MERAQKAQGDDKAVWVTRNQQGPDRPDSFFAEEKEEENVARSSPAGKGFEVQEVHSLQDA